MAKVETIRIPCVDDQGDPVDYKMKAVALRPEGEEAWEIFVGGDDSDLWIIFMSIAMVPSRMEVAPDQAQYLVNLAQLLGDPFDDVYQDVAGHVMAQSAAIENIEPRTRNGLFSAEPFDVRAWREQFMQTPYTDGEILRRDMLGVLPFAGRN